MLLSRLVASVILVPTLFTVQKAFAWGDLGHEIVGAVAEQNLNPNTKDFVRGIMGVEPLEVSAVFPDHVRDDDRFGHREADPSRRDADNHDFSDYHFCEIPTGFTYDTRPVKDVKDCYGALQGAITILKDTSGHSNKAEKAIALRYLVHIVGDIHQPLHVGNGFDLGANACQIKWQASVPGTPIQMNFHSFWDDTMVTNLGKTYANPATHTYAAKYLSDYMKGLNLHRPEMFTAAAKQAVGAGDLKQWLQETQQIRENGLYPDAPGSMAQVPLGQEYKNRPYCQWFTNQKTSTVAPGSVIQPDRIPTLGADYGDRFAPIVETQLLKGGLRVASLLDQIAADVTQSQRATRPMNDAKQEQVLKRVQDHFRNSGM